MYLKALAAIAFAFGAALFAPAQIACLADPSEAASAAGKSSQAASQVTGQAAGQAPDQSAAQAAGKVLVVLVYDQHCKVWCTHVRPIIRELAEEFGEKVHVEEIDNSPSSAEAALKQVKELGILALYKDVESVPVVMIFDVKRKQCKEINGPKEKPIYKAAIEKVIAKAQ
jgi:hypothetical protein